MKSWKTTLMGIVGAILAFLATYQQNGGDLKDWKLYLFPLLITIFGIFSKDFNVSGQKGDPEPTTPPIH